MDRLHKARIEWWLTNLPFVKWDRYTDNQDNINIYGWIDRKDQYKDFMLIKYNKQEKTIVAWTTSSAEYDPKIKEIMKASRFFQDDKNSVKCQRVESSFRTKNVVKLKDED